MIQNLIIKWHTIRANYHEILIKDCLDASMKQSLTKKLDYHKQQLQKHCQISA